MSKHSRLITAILSAMLMLTAFTFTSYAEELSDINSAPDEPSYDEPSYEQSSYVEPSYVEPSYDEPSYEQPSYVQPSYDEPSYDQPSYDNGQQGNDQTGDNNVYYDADGREYSNASDVYVGGEQTYTPPASIPDTTASYYDTSNTKVDTPTLTNSDWEAIKANLSSGSAKSSSSSGKSEFADMKADTSGQDKESYLVYIGWALLILSVIGFAYLIISKVRNRNKTELARAGKASGSSSNGPRYRDNSDYDDDYDSGSKKHKTPKNGKRYK